MAKRIIKQLAIDKKIATDIAHEVVDTFNGTPMEAASSVINGLFVGTMELASQLKQMETERGMTERMILSWFQGVDKVKGTEFCKYITLEREKEQINLSTYADA